MGRECKRFKIFFFLILKRALENSPFRSNNYEIKVTLSLHPTAQRKQRKNQCQM